MTDVLNARTNSARITKAVGVTNAGVIEVRNMSKADLIGCAIFIIAIGPAVTLPLAYMIRMTIWCTAMRGEFAEIKEIKAKPLERIYAAYVGLMLLTILILLWSITITGILHFKKLTGG